MLEKLKLREAELAKVVDQSVTHHNSIIGRLQETREWIKHLESEAEKLSEVIEKEVKEVVGKIV